MDDVRAYLDGAFEDTENRCIPNLWQTIQPLDGFQRRIGVEGPVCEIGVHHGKFLIGLMKTKRSRPNFAIDLFSAQQFNIDKSGQGDLDRFRECVDMAGESLDDICILERDSLTLNRRDTDRIFDETGGFSMFSVNGGYMVEHIVNDAQLAIELTVPGGIIFIGDYANPNWPGVRKGVAKLYNAGAPRFVPLVFSCNKLALCHISFHAQFLEHVTDFIANNFPGTRVRLGQYYGHDCISVFPDFPNDDYYVAGHAENN